MLFDSPDKFVFRHIGPRPSDLEPMLEAVGASSLDALIDEAIPADIRPTAPLAPEQLRREQAPERFRRDAGHVGFDH